MSRGLGFRGLRFRGLGLGWSLKGAKYGPQ